MRIADPGLIEHRLLDLAYTTDAVITAPLLAYHAPCSIADAERVLDDLVARDRLAMNVADDGTISYELLGRTKLPPRPDAPAPAPAPATPGLTRIRPPQRLVSPGLAAALSMLVPGAGQLYVARPLAAIFWFFVVSAGYVLLLPGLILHLFSIANAAGSAHRLNAAAVRHQLAA
ncbi:MAG TPA: hypothetical protein VGM88_21120 [Kofleriaceae bacterium]|jgi:hypothetical protein